MDAFGDNNFEQADVDPAAEFLAREQNALAGLEDELQPAAATTASAPAVNHVNDIAGLESSGSFEMINSIGDQSEAPQQPTEQGIQYTPPVQREEPEKIRKWREDQKQRLEDKDKEEEKKKEELREQAKKELEEWYKHHEETIAKTKAANRESAKNAEKQFVAENDEIEPGTEWERIAKLCDFNPKSNKSSRDVSRMRSIILQLKQNPLPAKRA
ncbi:clathrin light chain isoform X3 [Hermetia illucens]|uniref:clathrin light chain isoform X3 n=1 Tax=Hermetia illucens TaxID=343691 RepID=UPI0018CC2115|nr:clathrin light chain isoform X3 [Hermetia illucens]